MKNKTKKEQGMVNQEVNRNGTSIKGIRSIG